MILDFPVFKAEGMRILSVLGTRTAAVCQACAKRVGGDVSPKRGRKSKKSAIPHEFRSLHYSRRLSVGSLQPHPDEDEDERR